MPQACRFGIYLMASDGTGARQLTTSGAINLLPTWSPDGTRIAFTHVTTEGDGTTRADIVGQLGHSSITLTIDTYGHWSRKTQKATAKKVEGSI